MRVPHVPFALVDGRPFLIANYDLEPPGDLPPLSALLRGLLAHHAEADILLLRPLSHAEARLLRRSTGGAELEAWAQMVVRPDDRVRSRPTGRRSRRR